MREDVQNLVHSILRSSSSLWTHDRKRKYLILLPEKVHRPRLMQTLFIYINETSLGALHSMIEIIEFDQSDETPRS
jgi:hypothetical protein